VPLAAWLRGPLLERVEVALAAPAFTESGLFDRAAIRRLIEQHQTGRRDHGRTIWALFMLAAFLDRVHGRQEPSAGDRPTSETAVVGPVHSRPSA
jgi:asparagine synthase (glutamine-hydrolysing)